ncbi:MAG: riboflavin biosynthesis protein RibF [Mycoplasmataceae bacterium]|nr:riboflavin biosynthesis protein RibF [Mycoplasmataceae bacterium]
MKAHIFTNDTLNNNIYEKDSVIALGSFYSFHIGHQEIFKNTLKIASEKKLSSGIILFNEKGLFPKKETYSLNWRVNYLDKLGFDFVIIFDKTINNMSLEGNEFIKILSKNYGAKEYVCGNDFSFGKNRKWNTSMLMQKHSVKIVPTVKIDNVKVATTLVNEVIERGDLELLKVLLDRSYSVYGNVVHGEGNGAKFGFKTANIDLGNNLVEIPDGVYITYLKIEDKLYPSVTSVGKKPTIHKNYKKTYETHILNFNKNIYSKNVECFFLKKIRDQERYESIAELIKQIRKDKDFTIDWFINNKL